MPSTTARSGAWARWKSAISGISLMHGVHQVAQKFTTTHLPR